MLIGITGMMLDREGKPLRAEGAGKTTVANMLERHGFVVLACADSLKRFARDLFDFTDEQVFGPNEIKERVDSRYGISPRFALQKIGTEVVRQVYHTIWVGKAIRVARQLIQGGYGYSPPVGVWKADNALRFTGAVIHDIRFPNELEAIKAAGGYLVRVVRPSQDPPLDGLGHESSVALLGYSDAEFDAVIRNSGGVEDLQKAVDEFIEWLYDQEDEKADAKAAG